MAQGTSSGARRKRGPLRIVMVIGGVVVALLLVLSLVVALFGLRFASGYAKGAIADAARTQIKGSVDVDEIALSWRGPQRITNLVLRDPEGEVVADVSIEATTGVLPILFGERDLGELRVSGVLNIVQEAGEEKSTLAQAVEPRTPAPADGAAGPTGPSGGPSRIDRGLAARLVIDKLEVNYVDERPGAAAARASATLTADGGFRVGGPATLVADVDALVDGRPANAAIDLKIENLTTADGLVTVERAVANGTLDAQATAGFLAALPGLGEWIDLDALQATPSDPATINAKISGDAGKAEAALVVAAPGLSADLDLLATLSGDDPRLRLTKPGTASFVITPKIAATAQGDSATATLAAPARVQATIETFDMPMPSDGAVDLRTAALKISLTGEDLRGSATIPGEASPRQFSVGGLTARLESDDLAQRAVLQAGAAMTLDGLDAGALSVDMVASELANADGSPRGMPADIRGVASIKGLATALLEPFVQDTGLVLREDLGPTLDVALRAETAPSVEGGTAPTLVVLSADAAKLDAHGEFEITPARVVSRGEGLMVTLREVSPALARVLSRNAGDGVVASVGDPVTLSVTGVDVPLDEGDVRLDRAAASVRLATGNVRVGVGGEQETVALAKAEAGVTLAADQAPRVGLLAEEASGGMSAVGDVRLVNLFTPSGDIDAANALPIGTVRVRDLPVALARVAGLGEHVSLAQAAAGDTLTLTATTTEASAGGVNAEINVQGARLNAAASASVRPDAIDLRSAKATLTATPALVEQAVAQFAPDLDPRPSLARDVPIALEIAPVTIPADGWGQPNMARSPEVSATVRADGDIIVQRATMLDEQPVDVGLRGLTAEATYALASNEARRARVRAGVFEPDTPDRLVGTLTGDVALEANQPTEGVVKVEGLDTARADALLNKPGLLEWSMGPTANIEATLKPSGAWPPEKGGVAGAGTLLAEAVINSEKLTTSAALRVDEQSIVLIRPLDAEWTMEPRWADAYVLGADSGARITSPVRLNAKVQRLAIARGEGPLLPGVFDLDAHVTSPSAELTTPKGERIALQTINVKARRADAPGAVAFDASVARVDGPGGSGSVSANGEVASIADGQGRLTTDNAVLDLRLDGTFPTALVDLLADTDTTLQDLLGSTVSAEVHADDFSRTGGVLRAAADAPRADANLRGEVKDGAFVSAEPATARITEITREFSAKAIEPLIPVLAKFEKRTEDAPATVTVLNLRAPLEKTVDTDGDGQPDKVSMRGLNADIRMELGPVRYQTNDLFGTILKATKNDAEGRIFHNFPPLVVAVRDGIARYDRTRFPIGEFQIETSGTVDLEARTMDLIIYVPLAALVTEVAGLFQKVPGLDVMTMTPFRLKGPIGKAKPEPAVDMFLKDIATEAPKRIIEEGIGGVLDKVLGGDKNKKPSGNPQ